MHANVFSHCAEVKCSYALSEISHVYDFKKSGVFGVPNLILLDTGTKFFKTHKTGMNGNLIHW